MGRLKPRTEFGSPKVVSVLRGRGGWLRVVVPERPNGRPGWIRAAATRAGAVDVSLRVDRSARRLTVWRRGKVVRRVQVAVGRPGSETPTGRFAVTDKLRTRRPDSPYGCCAIALSGHQPKLLPGWPGGDRLAIHATPQTDSIGHGRLARLPARQNARSAGALADRAARGARVRQSVNTVSIAARSGPSSRV